MMSMPEAKKWLDDWDKAVEEQLKLSLSERREILLHTILELERKERFPFLKEKV